MPLCDSINALCLWFLYVEHCSRSTLVTQSVWFVLGNNAILKNKMDDYEKFLEHFHMFDYGFHSGLFLRSFRFFFPASAKWLGQFGRVQIGRLIRLLSTTCSQYRNAFSEWRCVFIPFYGRFYVFHPTSAAIMQCFHSAELCCV